MCPRRPTRIRRNARAKYVPLLFWGLMDRQVRRRYRACLYTSRFEVGTPDFKMTCSPASVPGAAAALRSLWPYVAFQSSRRAINLCRCQASGRGAVISSRSRGQRVALVFFMRCCLSRCNPYSKHSYGATCVAMSTLFSKLIAALALSTGASIAPATRAGRSAELPIKLLEPGACYSANTLF